MKRPFKSEFHSDLNSIIANTTQPQLTACTQQTLAGTQTQNPALDSHISLWKIPLVCKERLRADRSGLSSLPVKARGWVRGGSVTAPGGIMPLDELFLWSCTRDREQPCLHGAGRAPLVRNSFEPQQKPLKEVQEQGSEGEGLCVNEKSPNKSHSQPRGGKQLLLGAPAACWNLVPFKVPARRNQPVIPRFWSILRATLAAPGQPARACHAVKALYDIAAPARSDSRSVSL